MQQSPTRTIYFGSTRLIIATVAPSEEYHTLEVDDKLSVSRAKIVKKVENYKYIAIITPDVESTFRAFCSEFVLVDAAGGVVDDGSGAILMIYSREHWDLPKGHVEVGESCREAALREVEEETGIICRVVGDSPIAHTWHAYDTYGRWELKRTEWWAMRATGGELKAQSEEGIMQVEWCGVESLAERLKSSYATICEVVERYLFKRVRN